MPAVQYILSRNVSLEFQIFMLALFLKHFLYFYTSNPIKWTFCMICFYMNDTSHWVSCWREVGLFFIFLLIMISYYWNLRSGQTQVNCFIKCINNYTKCIFQIDIYNCLTWLFIYWMIKRTKYLINVLIEIMPSKQFWVDYCTCKL